MYVSACSLLVELQLSVEVDVYIIVQSIFSSSLIICDESIRTWNISMQLCMKVKKLIV